MIDNKDIDTKKDNWINVFIYNTNFSDDIYIYQIFEEKAILHIQYITKQKMIIHIKNIVNIKHIVIQLYLLKKKK